MLTKEVYLIQPLISRYCLGLLNRLLPSTTRITMPSQGSKVPVDILQNPQRAPLYTRKSNFKSFSDRLRLYNWLRVWLRLVLQLPSNKVFVLLL